MKFNSYYNFTKKKSKNHTWGRNSWIFHHWNVIIVIWCLIVWIILLVLICMLVRRVCSCPYNQLIQIKEYFKKKNKGLFSTCGCWGWSRNPICWVIHTQIWRAMWSSGFYGTWFIGTPSFGSHHGSIWSVGYAILVVLHHRGRSCSKRCSK